MQHLAIGGRRTVENTPRSKTNIPTPLGYRAWHGKEGRWQEKVRKAVLLQNFVDLLHDDPTALHWLIAQAVARCLVLCTDTASQRVHTEGREMDAMVMRLCSNRSGL
jgi:hypothetical protein